MGWANCGTDSKGRPIGYAHEATCDYPGCGKPIDRGLSYACGEMHGLGEHDCEGYFCGKHLLWVPEAGDNGRGLLLCPDCAEDYDRRREAGEFEET